MAFIKGKNLRLKFNDLWLLHATTCGLSIASKTEEVATKDTDGDEILSSGYGYTLSTSALMATLPTGDTTHAVTDYLVDAQLDETLVPWEFTTGVAGDRVYSGMCRVTQSDIAAENGSIATTGFSLVGSGNITRGVVPTP